MCQEASSLSTNAPDAPSYASEIITFDNAPDIPLLILQTPDSPQMDHAKRTECNRLYTCVDPVTGEIRIQGI